jgi:histidine triad (HIT) family protein
MTFLSENIFAKIITGDIPCDKIWENDNLLAFRDITPKAKTHILIIPKTEIKTAKEVDTSNLALFGELFLAAKIIAEQENLKGYKLHMNVDEAGGQVVPHLHLHLLSADFKTNL